MNETTIQNTTNDIISLATEKSQEGNDTIISDVIMKAIEKITKQGDTASGQNVPAVAIYHYINEKCSQNAEFSKMVLAEEKSLSGCYSYITQRAYEMAAMQNITNNNRNGNSPISIGLSSDEIFVLVDEYFTLSDDEIEQRKKTEQKAREEARKLAEEARKETEKKKAAEKAKAKKEKEAKKAADEKKKTEAQAAAGAQMSLFD